MKVSGAYIDGFGIFHDQSITGMDGNLILFYGHNEAGKSTLLGFFRSVLFGFPRANGKDPSYPPVAGGVRGGWIDLITDTGMAWRVQRKPGKGGGSVLVTGSDGADYGKSILDGLLGGVSYETFRNIMAFGLSELQSMETLSGEHIASAIYGAGLGTSMMAMPRARKNIRDKMARLFLKGGSKPVMNRLAGTLENIRKDLHAASQQTGEYDTTCDALARVEAEIATSMDALRRARKQQQHHAALERLWPDWVLLQESEQALADLGPSAGPFPEDGLTALERLVERRERERDRVANLTRGQKLITEKLALLPVEPQVLSQANVITTLVENRSTYMENIRRLPLLSQELQHVKDDIQRILQGLGGHWDEPAACGFDRSLFTREAVRRHQEDLETAERQAATAEEVQADRRIALDTATAARKRAEKDRRTLGPAPVERDRELVSHLRQGRDRLADALSEFRRTGEKLKNLQATLPSLEKATARTCRVTWWFSAVVWGLGLLASGAMARYGTRRDAGLILAAAVVTGGFIWIYRRQIYKTSLRELHTRQLQVEETEKHRRRLESILNTYLDLATKANVPLPGTPVMDETILNAVDHFFTTLSEEEKIKEAIRRAEDHLGEKKIAEESARRLFDTAGDTLKALMGKLSGKKASWRKWLREQGFYEALSPATAMEALNGLEQVVSAVQHKNRMEEELGRMEKEVFGFRRLAEKPLAAVGLVPDDTLPLMVQQLATRLEDSRGNQREREALQQQMESLEKEMATAGKKLGQTESDIQALLNSANVGDEAEFRKAGRFHEKREQLLSMARTAEQNMRRISGEADTADLKKALASLSLAEVKAENETAVQTVQKLDEDMSRHYTRQAELKHSLEALATNEDISHLRSEEEKCLADLEENAGAWSRYALADHLICRARDLFEKKHQPRIIQDAGNLFSRMTGGRYTGVVSPLGENTLYALSREGVRIDPGALSRGTAEQLYLSVRFSYIRHQARNIDPLPVIMDDILVNFDPLRARKAAEAIQDLSASHQVIFFTCHPETLAVFQQIDPSVPVFRLAGGRIDKQENHSGEEKITAT